MKNNNSTTNPWDLNNEIRNMGDAIAANTKASKARNTLERYSEAIRLVTHKYNANGKTPISDVDRDFLACPDVKQVDEQLQKLVSQLKNRKISASVVQLEFKRRKLQMDNLDYPEAHKDETDGLPSCNLICHMEDDLISENDHSFYFLATPSLEWKVTVRIVGKVYVYKLYVTVGFLSESQVAREDCERILENPDAEKQYVLFPRSIVFFADRYWGGMNYTSDQKRVAEWIRYWLDDITP